MPWPPCFRTAPAQAAQASQATARSAERLVRFHHAYMTTAPQHEASLRRIYTRELRLMLRRCLTLGWYLWTQRAGGA